MRDVEAVEQWLPILVAGVAAALAALPGCLERGYPLGAGGRCEARVEHGTLFAGNGDAARQWPGNGRVVLAMTEDDEPADGAYVTVRVEPAAALTLQPDDDSCEPAGDGLRCTGDAMGLAGFSAEAHAWSGTARITVHWSSSAPLETTIQVLPPGLPPRVQQEGGEGTLAFDLVITGSEDAEEAGLTAAVPATLHALTCTTQPLAPEMGGAWREGAIRTLSANVRARVTNGFEPSLDGAPVLVESLNNELALSPGASCVDRSSRLVVRLDATGRSTDFHWCFSDLGGAALSATASSGVVDLTHPVEFGVAPEPRSMRLLAASRTIDVADDQPEGVPLLELAVFDAIGRRMALDVRLTTDEDEHLRLVSPILSVGPDATESIRVHPRSTGRAIVTAAPLVDDRIRCDAPPIDVIFVAGEY